jgi:hypothetical protein
MLERVSYCLGKDDIAIVGIIDVSDAVSQWQAFQKGSKQVDTPSGDIGMYGRIELVDTTSTSSLTGGVR